MLNSPLKSIVSAGLIALSLAGTALAQQRPVESRAATVAASASAQQHPTELKIGMTTFLTGQAAVFGLPARAAAELFVEEINAAGGIGGVKLRLVILDEAMGAEKLAERYRSLVTEGGAKVMLASISSANCKLLAPIAEELKVLNVMWDCGTETILENHRYQYVFRSTGHATQEMVAAVAQLLRTRPKLKTIAVVNQDYAWGRDSWAIFRQALKRLKPDVEVVAEMFPKFGATDFTPEIQRLQSLKPDAIVSTAWGGDLDILVQQAVQAGAMRDATWVLPLGESSLERLGKVMPDGVIVGMRGDHYFLHPEYAKDFKHQSFVTKYRARTQHYPIYPVYHAVQGLQAVTTAYGEALKRTGGQWPSTEQVAAQMRKLLFRGLTRAVRIREDGQGLQEQMLGLTQQSAELGFATIQKLTIYPADIVTPPLGKLSSDWLKSLSPDMLVHPGIKTY